ncbi:MAG: DUF192 domain-containing protein [Patescibacteria group bacterium]
MKQILLPILAAIAFIVLVGFLTQGVQNGKISLANITQEKTEINISDTKIQVETARSDVERKKGLSKRESLGDKEGMLFIFPQKNIQPPFWMKDMKFAIDIIWIDDGKVVQIDENIPAPETGIPDEDLVFYTANQPVDYVLEVKAGFVEKNNIEKGDSVDLSLLE